MHQFKTFAVNRWPVMNGRWLVYRNYQLQLITWVLLSASLGALYVSIAKAKMGFKNSILRAAGGGMLPSSLLRTIFPVLQSISEDRNKRHTSYGSLSFVMNWKFTTFVGRSLDCRLVFRAMFREVTSCSRVFKICAPYSRISNSGRSSSSSSIGNSLLCQSPTRFESCVSAAYFSALFAKARICALHNSSNVLDSKFAVVWKKLKKSLVQKTAFIHFTFTDSLQQLQ